MTALRPERDGASYDSYDPYDDPGAFEAAVGQLGDPLTDPLPGQGHGRAGDGPAGDGSRRAAAAPDDAYSSSDSYASYDAYDQAASYAQPDPYATESAAYPDLGTGPAPYGTSSLYTTPATPYDRPAGYEETAYIPPVPDDGAAYAPGSAQAIAASETVAMPQIPAEAPGVPPKPADDATMALRQTDRNALKRPTDAVSRETGTPVPGGRAARRRAAQEAARRGGKRARRAAPAEETAPAAVPTSRVAARRAQRAQKESVGVIASRLVGEAFITVGVLMLLFVAYQLWWTNVLAHNQAGGAANNLQKQWDEGGKDDRAAGAFSPGQGFAIMYIPKLDVKVPIAQGISKHGVLDRGMVGHYSEGQLKTAMPWDKKGNFALAGHRNTHGEPFRYINRLVKGDKIVVETRNTFYTYEMESILPQTPPSNVGVIGPVPPGSGFTEPGRYITLTTCTPEFTSTYRMIVWGKMVEERPRSKGKPDALVS